MGRRFPVLSLVFIAVVAIGLFVAWLAERGPDEVAEVGGHAPGFDVELLEGGTYELEDDLAAGKPVVLNLWASWCVPCRTEMPEISRFAADHPDVSVIGVAVEDRVEQAQEFADEIDPVYPLAMGDAAFEAAYPRLGLPVTYFIDSSGVVRDIYNGVVDAATLADLTGG